MRDVFFGRGEMPLVSTSGSTSTSPSSQEDRESDDDSYEAQCAKEESCSGKSSGKRKICNAQEESGTAAKLPKPN